MSAESRLGIKPVQGKYLNNDGMLLTQRKLDAHAAFPFFDIYFELQSSGTGMTDMFIQIKLDQTHENTRALKNPCLRCWPRGEQVYYSYAHSDQYPVLSTAQYAVAIDSTAQTRTKIARHGSVSG